jgi:hypothetical protein
MSSVLESWRYVVTLSRVEIHGTLEILYPIFGKTSLFWFCEELVKSNRILSGKAQAVA